MTKTCERCGREYPKPPRISLAQWAKRRACSIPCANALRAAAYNPMDDPAVRARHGQAVRTAPATIARRQRTSRRRAEQRAAQEIARADRERATMLAAMLRDLDSLARRASRRCTCKPCLKARHREQTDQWERDHPDAVTRYRRAWKTAKASTAALCTEAAARDRYDFYGGACAYCRKPLPPFDEHPRTWQWDHAIPLSRGGTGHPANLRPACGDCNKRKGARTPAEWQARRT